MTLCVSFPSGEHICYSNMQARTLFYLLHTMQTGHHLLLPLLSVQFLCSVPSHVCHGGPPAAAVTNVAKRFSEVLSLRKEEHMHSSAVVSWGAHGLSWGATDEADLCRLWTKEVQCS